MNYLKNMVGSILDKYLTPYFHNFKSQENLKMESLNEFGIKNLVFNDMIVGALPFPVKLKYGQIGEMTISVPSYTNLATQGI